MPKERGIERSESGLHVHGTGFSKGYSGLLGNLSEAKHQKKVGPVINQGNHHL